MKALTILAALAIYAGSLKAEEPLPWTQEDAERFVRACELEAKQAATVTWVRRDANDPVLVEWRISQIERRLNDAERREFFSRSILDSRH